MERDVKGAAILPVKFFNDPRYRFISSGASLGIASTSTSAQSRSISRGAMYS
jgi:hypothetical protein